MVWTNLCRICAEMGETYYSIFENPSERNIELKIKKCFSLTISKDDYKPKEICNCCYIKLNQFYQFIELCHASNKKFEAMIYSTSQGVWLEKQTRNFDCQMNGVIVNTKATASNQLNTPEVIMVVDYDDPMNLNGNISDQLTVTNCNYKPIHKTPDNSFKSYHQYDQTQTVLRHSCDFYKTADNMGVTNLNYTNMNLDQVDEKANRQNNVLEIDNSYKRSNSLIWHKSAENINQKPEEFNDSTPTFQETPKSYSKSDNICNTKAEVQKHEPTKTKRFSCQQCNKKFMRKLTLNAHVAVHTKIRPFVCEICDKTFATQRDLTCHKRLHTNMYQCKYCSKNFVVPSKLERHLRTHTNVKPYICPVESCGKSFSDKCNLEGHKVIHSEERNFMCDICDKRYKTNSQLKDHKKVHSDEKLHKCNICMKSYKWKVNLTIHMKKHDGYKCLYCQKDCEKLSTLYKHRKVCKNKKSIDSVTQSK